MPLTATEELIQVVNSNHASIMAEYQKVGDGVRELKARTLEIEQRLVARRGGGFDNRATDTLGAKVVASDSYKHFRETMRCVGKIKIEVQNAITSLTEAAGGALVRPDRQREIVGIPRIRPTVRSLLAPGTTGSNMVEYTKQIGRTNLAGAVSEGALKPESSITFELAEAPVRTIATWIPASKQIMGDAPQLQQFLDSELRFMLAMEEELQILFGSGIAPDLQGLSVQVTEYVAPFNVDSPTRLDVLLLAMAQAQQSRIPATGIIVNDLDWAQMQAIKDGEGRYIGAGPFGNQPSVAWTLPVVATPSMTEDHFMVGGFAIAAQIIDREETNVTISTEDRDNFVRNMVSVLCEERVALAVKIPEAVVFGEFGQVSG